MKIINIKYSDKSKMTKADRKYNRINFFKKKKEKKKLRMPNPLTEHV